MNLYPSPNADRLKEQNYFISAAATSERYKDAYRAGDEYKIRATVAAFSIGLGVRVANAL